MVGVVAGQILMRFEMVNALTPAKLSNAVYIHSTTYSIDVEFT